MSWRYWLIDAPAHLTEVGQVWFRLYFVVLVWIAALTLPVTVLSTLVLWFGFGIRWGW